MESEKGGIVALLVFLAIGIALYAGYRMSLPDAVGEPSREQYPMRGIDISAHNGVVDFNAVKKAGISFVYIKMTEGADFKDSRFVHNIRMARQAGLKVGVYHFFRFDSDGVGQAINILHSLRGRRPDMPIAIDIEEWANPSDVTPAAVRHELGRLLDYLHQRGYHTMIYTNKDGYYRFIHRHFPNEPLWICSFSEVDAGIDWIMWQYSHSGDVDGAAGKVDMDLFASDSLQWKRWCEQEYFPAQ